MGALVKWELSLSDEAEALNVLPLIVSPVVLLVPSEKQWKKLEKKRSSLTEKEAQKEGKTSQKPDKYVFFLYVLPAKNSTFLWCTKN